MNKHNVTWIAKTIWIIIQTNVIQTTTNTTGIRKIKMGYILRSHFQIFCICASIIIIGGMGNIYAYGELSFEGLLQHIFFLNDAYDELVLQFNELVNEHYNLSNDYDLLLSKHNILSKNYDDLLVEYNLAADNHGNVNENGKEYPRTTILGTDVIWQFLDSKDNYYQWSIPIFVYEEQIQYGSAYSIQQQNENFKILNVNGHSMEVINLDGFVHHSFTDTVDSIYDNSNDNADFIYNVWYIVSEMTTYDIDVRPESEGRYALETLTRGGGDCEDLVILIADLLMSSKHTSDWHFQYVYMDLQNPTDPREVNHIVLYVHDGTYSYTIEATAPPNWEYYPNGIIGWYFDVV